MGKTSTTPKTPKTPKAQQKTPKRKEPPKSDANGEKQENEAKRQKQQPDLMSFFKPKEKPAPLPTLPKCMPNNSLFQTLFQLKAGMTLAPIFVRQPLTASERDHLLDQHNEVSKYLAQCKGIKKKAATNVDVLKAKYYHFKADGSNRPPYYGTWRRRSAAITGRRPFNKEEKTLNYDYDSDDDWEDEPADADECKSDDEELEKEDEQMSESEDDGFFVDHGYLSSDEGSGAEEDDELLLLRKGKPGDGEEAKLAALVPPHHSLESEEQRRQRLAQKAEEWKDQQRQKERRNKKRQLIPTVYLPAEYIHPVLHRNIMAGVLFDYSTILASSNLDAMDGNGKVGEEEVLVPPPPPPNPLDQMPAELKMAMTAAGSSG